MKIYTLYLNTASTVGMYKPVKIVDSANVNWFIDWDNLFGINIFNKINNKFNYIYIF